MQDIIEEIKHIRGLIDDLYEIGPQSKTASALFIELNDALNSLQGMCYGEVAKQVSK